jgi:hypothetical protein
MITVRPSELLCAVCWAGGCSSPPAGAERVQEIIAATKADMWGKVKVDLDMSPYLAHYYDVYAGRGAHELPPSFEAWQSDYATRMRDLSALRKLGLQPGDVRIAFDLVRLLLRNVTSLEAICRFAEPAGPGWEECPYARSGVFERMREGRVGLGGDPPNNPMYIFLTPRSDEETAAAKAASVAAIEKAERLFIRPAHLMCIACYYGGGGDEPLSEDNLYELRLRMEENPDIPVTLTEGCCMVCDSCHAYDPERNICFHAHVRTPLRDLMVLRKLGLRPGSTLPAREMYRLLFERIPTAPEICGWGDMENVTAEWLCCGGATSGNYERAIERGFMVAEVEE